MLVELVNCMVYQFKYNFLKQNPDTEYHLYRLPDLVLPIPNNNTY